MKQIHFCCRECGKEQPKDEKSSNENWEVFDAKAKCICGGEYEMVIGDLVSWRKRLKAKAKSLEDKEG